MKAEQIETGNKDIPRRARYISAAIGWTIVAATVGVSIGGATSYGQLLLPGPINSLANSVSGWVLPAFIAVFLMSKRPFPRQLWFAGFAGAVILFGMLQGYAIVSTLRGYFDSYGPGTFYFWAAIIGGPIVGIAAALQHSRIGSLRSLSIGLITAILIGDGVSGLVRVAATTGWIYWALSIAVGVIMLAWVVFRRLRSVSQRGLAVLSSSVGATLYVLWFSTM